MKYEDILKYLNRYTFDEKITICTLMSAKALKNHIKHDINTISRNVLPEDLELFTMFVIKSKDDSHSSLETIEGKRIINGIFKAIRSHTFKRPSSNNDGFSIADYIMPIILMSQTFLQRDLFILYYRFNYMFHYESEGINLCNVFKETFGTDYDEYIQLGFVLTMLFILDQPVSNEILTYILIQMFPLCSKQLTISRDKYKAMIEEYASKIDDYHYSIRPSYRYPFILYNRSIYIPLPHVIVQSTTLSLLYRLTQGNDDLNSNIGKSILESYLFHLADASGQFEEVYKEKEYKAKHNNSRRTLDVLCRANDEYVFFDSKSYKPKSKIRLSDDTAINADILRLAEMIIQVYEHILLKFPDEYNPFSKKPETKENIWGIVVIFEDSFIRRKNIYDKARILIQEKYSRLMTDQEFEWMICHVRIFELYSIEEIFLNKLSIIESLHIQRSESKYFDYTPTIPSRGISSFTDEFKRFRQHCMDKLNIVIKELVQKGFIDDE